MMTDNYILEVNDDGVLTFTDELLEATGWKEGTILEFIDNGDGSVSLKEVKGSEDDN